MKHYIIRPNIFGDKFLLLFHPEEFIMNNIILTKFPEVAKKAGLILSIGIKQSNYFGARCLNDLTQLLSNIPKCNSSESIDIICDLIIQCKKFDETIDIMNEVVSLFQKSSKEFYENQSASYNNLASHHTDLVEDFPLDLIYLPPVATPSNTFHSFKETGYYSNSQISDVKIDFDIGPLAIYRIVAKSSLESSSFVNHPKLIIIYYWPIGLDFKQEPKFLSMTSTTENEITIIIEQQILCHGIRIITIPGYPQFRGTTKSNNSSSKKSNSSNSKSNDNSILTMLQLFGENPYTIIDSLIKQQKILKKYKDDYLEIKTELIKVLQSGHISLYENTIHRLKDTRTQYLQNVDTFNNIYVLSQIITNEEHPLESYVEIEESSSKLSHWAVICKKLCNIINSEFELIKKPLDQITLKAIFRYITGICVPSVRNDAAIALTSLIVKSNTWDTWVVDIFLEYFASSNINRSISTVPKKIILEILNEMIPSSKSTTATGQLFALMEATMSESSLDLELLGWLLLVVSGNELFQKQKNINAAHIGSVCANCDARPIYGMRFRCAFCIDYDLCSNCEPQSKSIHNSKHEFVVMKNPLPPYPHAIQSGSDFHISSILRSALLDEKINELPSNSGNQIIHQFTVCYECGIAPIIGVRYKCLYCPNFDYCERCFLTQDHLEHHLFLKKKSASQDTSLKFENTGILSTLLHPSFYPKSVRTGTVGYASKVENIAMRSLVRRGGGSRISSPSISSSKKKKLSKISTTSYLFPDIIPWDNKRNSGSGFLEYCENPLVTIVKILSYSIKKSPYIFQLGLQTLHKLAKHSSIDMIYDDIILHYCFPDILNTIFNCDSFCQGSLLNFLESILQEEFYSKNSNCDFRDISNKIKNYLSSFIQKFLSIQRELIQVEYALDILSLILPQYDITSWVIESNNNNSDNNTTSQRMLTSPRNTGIITSPRPSPSIIKKLNPTTSDIGITVTRTKGFTQAQLNQPSLLISSSSSSNIDNNDIQQPSQIIKDDNIILPLIKDNIFDDNNNNSKKQLSDDGFSLLSTLEQMNEQKRKKPISNDIIDLLLQLLNEYPLSNSSVQIWNRILLLLSKGDPNYIGNSKELKNHLYNIINSSKLYHGYIVLEDAFKKIFRIILSPDLDSNIYYSHLSEITKQIQYIGNDNSDFINILLDVLYDLSTTRILKLSKKIIKELFESSIRYLSSSSHPNMLIHDKIFDLLQDTFNRRPDIIKIITEFNIEIWNEFFDFLDEDETALDRFLSQKIENFNNIIIMNYNKLSYFVHSLLLKSNETSLFFIELLSNRIKITPGPETIACFLHVISIESTGLMFVKKFNGHEYLLNLLVGEKLNDTKIVDLQELLLSALQPGPEPVLTNTSSQYENLNSLAKVVACSSDSLLTRSSVFSFKEPYLLTCKFPCSVILKSVCVTVYSEFHQRPPENITISTSLSDLPFSEYTHKFSFISQGSSIFQFDLPSNHPCYYIKILINPSGGDMQLCNISLLGLTIRTKQHVFLKNIGFSYASLMMKKLLEFNSIQNIISDSFGEEPYLSQVLELCSLLHDNVHEFLLLIAYSNPIIADAIIKRVLQLPTKTQAHAILVENLCTYIKNGSNNRIIILQEFVLDQLAQFDVIPFIEALCKALLNQKINLSLKQIKTLIFQIRNTSNGSAIYNSLIVLLCITLSNQPEYFKEILNFPLSNDKDLNIEENSDNILLIGECVNASSECTKLLLQSPILRTVLLHFNSIFEDNNNNNNNNTNGNEINDENKRKGGGRERRSSFSVLRFMASEDIQLAARRSNSHKSSSSMSADFIIPKNFIVLSTFLLNILHSINIKEWAGNSVLPICIRALKSKTTKVRQRILEIIESFCNGSISNQKIVTDSIILLTKKLKVLDLKNWQTFVQDLSQIRELLSLKETIACNLIESSKSHKIKNNHHTPHTPLHIEYMRQMMINLPKDVFKMQGNYISTVCNPTLYTIFHPTPLKLPFSIEIEIREISDFFSVNNLFIGFGSNRKGLNFDKFKSSYENRAIGTAGASIAFSGEFIFQLGNSYCVETSPSFVSGDIIQANITTDGIVSFKYNGSPIICKYTRQLTLPTGNNKEFYFGLSVYNLDLKIALRPLSLPSDDITIRKKQKNESLIIKDVSALRYLRVNSMYRLPSTYQLYQLIPIITDSKTNLDDIKILFNIPSKLNEPIPLSTSLLELQSLMISNHREIIDIEYTIIPRIATDEHDTLENEIQQAKTIVLPTTCYPILQKFSENNGLEILIELLQKSCKTFSDTSIQQIIDVQNWFYHLLSLLKIPGYKEMFISNSECIFILLEIIQWIIRCICSINTESNQKLEQQVLNSLNINSNKLFTPLDTSLTHLFNLPGKKNRIIEIRDTVIKSRLIHQILTNMSIIENEEPLQPELFEEELKIEIDQYTSKSKGKLKTNSKTYWAKGTGFGTNDDNNSSSWRPEKFAKQQLQKSIRLANIFKLLTSFIRIPEILSKSSNKKNILSDEIFSIFEGSSLIPIIQSYLRNDSMFDILKYIILYRSIFNFLRAICDYGFLIPLLIEKYQNISIVSLIGNLKQSLDNIFFSERIVLEDDQLLFQEEVSNTYKILSRAERKKHRNEDSGTHINSSGKKSKKKGFSSELEAEYKKRLSLLQYLETDGIGKSKIYKYSENALLNVISKETTHRLVGELSTLSKNLPLHWSSSVFLSIDPSNISVMQALITGPEKTPYANGCFLCKLKKK